MALRWGGLTPELHFHNWLVSQGVGPVTMQQAETAAAATRWHGHTHSALHAKHFSTSA